jgi:hypothetical protein
MTTREDAARAFADAMGWERVDGGFKIQTWPWGCPLPPVDDPIYTHLAFVGRVAEAAGLEVRDCGFIHRRRAKMQMVTFAREATDDDPDPDLPPRYYQWSEEASDLSWAGMLAATASKAGT